MNADRLGPTVSGEAFRGDAVWGLTWLSGDNLLEGYGKMFWGAC